MKRVISIIICAVLMVISVPYANAAATPKLVAITFDDGPSVYTEGLLDGLAQRGAKATFFIVGNMASARTSVLQRMVNEGHQIANHTTSHPDLSKLSAQSIINELNGCANYLKQAGGEQQYLLRPPYGSYNSTVRNNANMPIILWSVDTLDWKYRNSDTVYNNIINNTTDGSIVLLHDLYKSSVNGALRAIDTLKERGYEFVTVNELFRRRAVTLENGKVYSAAYNKGITLPATEKPKSVEITFENVYGGKQVSLTCPTENVSIHYTTDGSEPNENSPKYTSPFLVTSITDIKAVAYNSQLSDVSFRKIWVEPAPAPAVSFENSILTLTPSENTTVYYTLDTSAPTDMSTVYTEPLTIDRQIDLLVRAVGKADRRITYVSTAYGKLFSDIKASGWYYNAVSEAVNCGIMTGVSEFEFSPTGNVTRAMFVTVLHRMSKDAQTEYAPASFVDIDNNLWYAKAAAWAQSTGIVKGVSETEFAPNVNITRQEMCTMLARFFEYYEIALPVTEREAFADADTIAEWAKTSVDMLYLGGLINGVGDNLFAPTNTATRAECAKLSIDTYKTLNK